MPNKESIEIEIAKLIVETLSLEDINPSDIDFDKPLFYDGLGLDSIDSLELSITIGYKTAQTAILPIKFDLI
jgi:acyl carrier protein